MTNRRDFIRNASLLTLGGLFAGKAGQATAANPVINEVMAKKSFGLQTYSVMSELAKDVPAGLKKIKSYGYTYLELAGYGNGAISGVPMTEYKKMCDDAGLPIRCSHMNPPVREYTKESLGKITEFWKKAADDHASIGCKMIVQPGQPSTRSVEEVAYVGEVFNKAGQIAKEAGLSFGYHNHSGEFARVIPGGTEPWRGGGGSKAPEGIEMVYDGMLRNTDPSLVFFELDVYWAVMGQQDPVEYMKKYADRIRVLHIKDRAVLGQSGMMNFETIFKQAYATKIDTFFVELEGIKNMTQFEGVKGCAEYLTKAKFVK